MKPATTELDKFGRIVVPKAAREELGLDPGARLAVEVEGRELRLKPVSAPSGIAERDGFLVATGRLHRGIEGAVDDARDERARTIAGRLRGRVR